MKKKQRRYTLSKAAANYKNRPFLFSEETYLALVSLPCYYCNNKLGNVQLENGLGLDRINNDRGYENENVIPCCSICNRTRNTNFTVQETKAMITTALSLRVL